MSSPRYGKAHRVVRLAGEARVNPAALLMRASRDARDGKVRDVVVVVVEPDGSVHVRGTTANRARTVGWLIMGAIQLGAS